VAVRAGPVVAVCGQWLVAGFPRGLAARGLALGVALLDLGLNLLLAFAGVVVLMLSSFRCGPSTRRRGL
jgi:hypothetical protein